jgi:hypothetical protein
LQIIAAALITLVMAPGAAALCRVPLAFMPLAPVFGSGSPFADGVA